MSRIPQFAQYAAAFERSYASDDWSHVAPFFAEDAVYDAPLPAPLGGVLEGRDAILAYFQSVLTGFDRRFASRELILLEGPREEGDAVWIRGGVRYQAPGVSDLYFELEETAIFDGDRIRRLEDRYDADQLALLESYLREHGAKLGIAIGEARD